MMKALEIPLPEDKIINLKLLESLRFDLLRGLVREEAMEFDIAMAALEECKEDLVRNHYTDGVFKDNALDSWADVIDAMCDLIVVIHNTSNAMGIDLEPYFDEVHRTNMAKVGGPTREDGKKLKPPGWQPPRILEMLKNELSSSKVRETYRYEVAKSNLEKRKESGND